MYGQSGRGLMYNFYININCKALDGPKWNRSDIASRSGSRCDTHGNTFGQVEVTCTYLRPKILYCTIFNQF